MINKNKTFFILIVLVFGCKSAIAESEILEDFKKLRNHYEMNDFAFDFSVEYFDKAKKSVLKQNGRAVHAANFHFVDMMGHLTILDENEFLSVNPDLQMIVYQKSNQNSKSDQVGSINEMLDSMWSKQEHLKYSYLTKKGNIKRIFIEDLSTSDFNSYEITIDHEKSQILGFKYYFKEERNNNISSIEINYFNEISDVKKEIRSKRISRYVDVNAKSPIVFEKYKSFQFYNSSTTDF